MQPNPSHNPSLRLLFGKRELEIIEKQQKNIRLTTSEKTRLSGTIKRKIKAIESWKPLNLEKGIFVKDKINIALDCILSDSVGKKIKRIYLFGSQITGKAKPDSDIDLAVDMPVKNPLTSMVDLQMLLPYEWGELFDISILNYITFKEEILKNGKLIYTSERGKIPLRRFLAKNESSAVAKRPHRASGG